jgi:hypothetical protein
MQYRRTSLSRWFGQLLVALESHARGMTCKLADDLQVECRLKMLLLSSLPKAMFTASGNRSVEIRAEACSRGDHLAIA